MKPFAAGACRKTKMKTYSTIKMQPGVQGEHPGTTSVTKRETVEGGRDRRPEITCSFSGCQAQGGADVADLTWFGRCASLC